MGIWLLGKKRKQLSDANGVTGRSCDCYASQRLRGRSTGDAGSGMLASTGSVQPDKPSWTNILRTMVSGEVVNAESSISDSSKGKNKVRAGKITGLRLNKVETVMLAAVNHERGKHGLIQLEIDDVLQKLARKHCRWMAATGTFRHSRDVKSENIAEGQRSVKSVMRDWLSSQGHRSAMLDTDTQLIGVAGYRGKNGKNYWVQQFQR